MMAVSSYVFSKPGQLLLVAIAVGVCTYIAGRVDFRTSANALWILGIPLLVTSVANRTWDSRLYMLLPLIVCSLISVMLTGEFFGLA